MSPIIPFWIFVLGLIIAVIVVLSITLVVFLFARKLKK